MATLKISDLSVGDWVLNHRDYPTKVQVITTDGNLFLGELDAKPEHCTHLWVQDIKPIPITAEVLEANGWDRNEEDEYMEYYGDPTSGITHTKGTYHYRLEVPDVSVVCYFVHQLQHAMRLAGVDKEINL